jgi:hypothetical protein
MEAKGEMGGAGTVNYKAALEKGKEGAQATDPGQTSMKKYLSPKKKPGVEDENRQREVARVMEPVIDKIKKEIELGAQGYHAEDVGVRKRGEETESDEERRLQKLKRKPSRTQGQGQGKEREQVWVPTLKKRRGRIAEDGRLLPKGTIATDVHGRLLEENEEMLNRCLEKARRILDYVRQHPDHYPPVERHKSGRPVALDENDAYAQGLKVALVPDPQKRRARYAYLVFVELDLVVKSELGLLPVNAIASGRLFMPSDIVSAFGPKKGKQMDGLIVEEVQNMAPRDEVREFRRQRNCAMLASWGELKIQSKQDKLRTMTWADLGLRYNIEPFRKESVQRYVTLPGMAADPYIHEANLGFDTLLESLDVWKAVSSTPFPSFYHDRNFKGADALRYCYGDIQRMGVKAGPDGVVRFKQPKPTTITFMADEREAPTEDEGERPPKMKPIRSLAEEETEEESEGEPLLTKRKRKGVNEQEGQHEPFLLAIGGQAGPDGGEGGMGYLELPNYFNKHGGPRKEKRRARSSPSPKEDLPKPDIPLSEQVLEPRARRPTRASSPSAGLGGLETSQLDPGKLKEAVLEKPQLGEPLAKQKKGLEERPRSAKPAKRQSWSDMMEADKAEAARAEAETTRTRAEWEARKKDITGGPLNPTNEHAVELPSQLAHKTLTVVHGGGAGLDPAQHTVKRGERGAAGDKDERAQAEGGPIDSQATTDEETVKAQFKISPVKAGGAEARAQVGDGSGREKKAGEDAALEKRGGAEGGGLGEEEGEPMEGLEEERPVEMGSVEKEKLAESQMVEERQREEEDRVKKEKKDRKKKK